MDVGELNATLTADTSDWSAKMSAASADVLKVGAAAGAGSAVATAALGLLSGAFSTLTELIPKAAERAAEYAFNIAKVSQQTGLTTQYISALTPALNEVGLSTHDLAMGFRKLSQDVEAAANPASKAAELFNRLGLAASELADPGQALSMIAQRLSQLPDGFEKTRLATELLSRTGINLIPILNKGAAGFQESGEKAAKMGLILSGSAVKSLEEMHVAMKDAETAADSLQVHIGLAFAPIITWFEKLKTAAAEASISLVDELGGAMLKLGERAKGLGTFLADAWKAPDVAGIVAAYQKADAATATSIAAIEKSTAAIGQQASQLGAVNEKMHQHALAAQAAGEKQEALGLAMRTTSQAVTEAIEKEYGTKNLQEAIKLTAQYVDVLHEWDKAAIIIKMAGEGFSPEQILKYFKGRFLDVFTPEGMQEQLDKGTDAIQAMVLKRKMLINEYGLPNVEASEMLNSVFEVKPEYLGELYKEANAVLAVTGNEKEWLKTLREIQALKSVVTTPGEVQQQGQLGLQANTAFQEDKRVNAMRLEDARLTSTAIQAVQTEQYKNQIGFIGAADAARRVAYTAEDARITQESAHLKQQFDSGLVDAQSYQTRLQAIENTGVAKRMQIISQYPTFFQKQLQDLANSNTFSMAQIVTGFTGAVAKIIVEGGKLKQFWISLQTTLVQAALNAGVQMLAGAALNFLKETALAKTFEAAKIALMEAGFIAKVATDKASAASGTAAAAGSLAAMGALAVASLGVMEAVTIAIAAIFAAIGAALATTVVGSVLAPEFEVAAGAVIVGGTAGGIVAGGIITGALSSASTVLAASAIPKLAAGGVVDKATLLIAGESGPEAIVPLDQYAGKGGGQPMQITLELDGRMLSQNNLKWMPSQIRMAGVIAR